MSILLKMASFGSLFIFSLVIHVVISTDCQKSDIPNDDKGNHVFKPDDGSNTIPDGGSVTVQCTTFGYLPTDGDGKKIHCSNGTWVGTLSSCKPAKCLKHRMTSPPMENGVYKFEPDSGVEEVAKGTLAMVECNKGYRLVKKTVNGDYKETAFNDSDAFYCHFSVWVGRKATDLGYKCELIGKVLLIGAISGDGDKIMELYDTEHPENNALVGTPLTAGRQGHTSGVFDDGLVAIAGGYIDGQLTSDTQFYDPKEDQLNIGNSMSVERAYLGSAMLNNEMIVCGGGSPGVSLATCERLYFDQSAIPNQYKWGSFKAMINARYYHAMTQYKNELFVIGGLGRAYSGSATGERYKKTTEIWEPIDPMPTARSSLSAAGLGDFIYACGGEHTEKVCEKYNLGTNTWTPAASMNTGGYGFTLIPMEREGKMYAFTDTMVVELFNATTGLWTNVSTSMRNSHRYGKAVQLKPTIV